MLQKGRSEVETKQEVAKHTPGPWEARQHAHRADGSHTSTIVYQKDQYSPVAIVACHVELNNAALIAAAPELLGALKDAKRWIQQVREQNDDYAGTEMPEKLADVIAKAEGRS